MVILKNIKKTNDAISADYYPEGKEPKGFMKMKDGKCVGTYHVCGKRRK